MNPYYNQNYTKDEIAVILKEIKTCIEEDRFTIELNENRVENKAFVNDYNLSSSKQKEILLEIEVEDFCHSLKNTKPGYTHEILYVFCPQVELIDIFAEDKVIDIYTKFNLIEYNVAKRVITVSFHERNRPISYCFDR